ncbi:Transcription initiation Spt4-like domain-containing protein [Rozella allomycis CSF55]|uniref:Transcription elongation factor SPT4 n=1 Tax=Rozella allomycis (strain CSF55) TaxID=988480 RepID=A0A075APH3_ROZAC|nr:Transcription initiation Spt4-like domain-containing protein [Rozella allomycis CSF55]|eukprot:EPZ31948.1 Transcription initiation Spt4-like domain-containing protein [Rozella allomycis CSF55]
MEIVPTDTKRLRACLLCSLTMAQFKMNGCENCESLLMMKGNTDRIFDCTSQNFDGCTALMAPGHSWVDKFSKGIYALKVYGRLPEDLIAHLEDQGVNYTPLEEDD